MDERRLKKALEKELDSIAPKMSDKVAAAPIGTSSEPPRRPDRRRKSRRVAAISAIAAVLVVAIALAAILPSVFGAGTKTGGSDGYLMLSINPDVEILFDEDGKVTVVKSSNADADVLLADSEFAASLIGEDVTQAAAAIAAEALALGYVQGDEKSPSAVKLTVVGGYQDCADEIGAAVREELIDLGAACLVVTEEADETLLQDKYGMDGELADLLAAIADSADSYFSREAARLGDDMLALTQIYSGYISDYLKDRVRIVGAQIDDVKAMLDALCTLNDEIAVLCAGLRFGTLDLWEVNSYWDAEEYLAEHPQYLPSDLLTQAITQGRALLAALEEYGCAPTDEVTLLALCTAFDWIDAAYDEIEAQIFEVIDQADESVSAIVADVSALYNEAVTAVSAWLDSLPTIMTDFSAALGEIAAFADTAIESAEDFVQQAKALTEDAREDLQRLGSVIENARPKIDREDYENIEQQIIGLYGSLSEWYDAAWSSQGE